MKRALKIIGAILGVVGVIAIIAEICNEEVEYYFDKDFDLRDKDTQSTGEDIDEGVEDPSLFETWD